MKTRTKEYDAYIQSDAWKAKRAAKLAQTGNKCAKAGDIRYRSNDDGTYTEVDMCSGPLQVHHIRYDHLGDESMSDLEVMCEWHHRQEHKSWQLNALFKNTTPKKIRKWH